VLIERDDDAFDYDNELNISVKDRYKGRII